MNQTASMFLKITYQGFIKPLLFQIDPETVHIRMTSFAQTLGESQFNKQILSHMLVVKDKKLTQTIAGIRFENPIGLAAGFDYEAKLTQITPSLGFGFHSVGTISHFPYEGNPRPRLGRLPLSKSLMVNKGFKNLGAPVTARMMQKKHFSIPIGVSIGRTNDPHMDQKKSVVDIINAFTIFEKAKVPNHYYELNISCPNLLGTVSFYTTHNLDKLLMEVDKLRLKKPLFIKMPITQSDREIRKMLDVIANHSPAGIILGNLQKDRTDPALVPQEVRKFSVGNFSGKPTFVRSNQLISLAYKFYHPRLVIIGCGGVFSAADAYEKMRRGASLVQLITGLIYQGPQLVNEINVGLLSLLKKRWVKAYF